MRFVVLILVASVVAAPTCAEDPPKVEPKIDLKKGVALVGHAEATVVQVRPWLNGLLTRIHVKAGEAVRKGDVLAELDDRVCKLDLTAAKAKLAVAQADAKLAAADFARIREAFTKGVVGKDELTKAEAANDKTAALVEVAKAVVQLAEVRLTWTKLIAPIDGKVGRFTVTEGDIVVADKTIVTAVIVDNPIAVVFDVDERTTLAIRRAVLDGGKVSVEVGLGDEEGYPHKGDVDVKGLVVDPKTSTVRFRASLDNPKGLILHGQFARVKLTVQPK